MKQTLAVIGGLLLLGGLILGFAPQSAGGVDCGSVFKASDEAGVADLQRTLGGAPDDGLSGLSPNQNACDDRRSLYKPIVWVLLGLGGVMLLGAAVIYGNPTDADRGIERTPQ